MLFNPHKGQWWNEPAESRTTAYYMTLRVHYGMCALEAWDYIKRSRSQYPGFVDDPIGSIKTAIRREA